MVHVKTFPWFKAVCSTGKLKVRPRGSAWSVFGVRISSMLELVAKGSCVGDVGEAAELVRNASTESAR